MSRHFPQIEEIQQWTNEYTGVTLRPSEGSEGERQGTFTNNKEGIERRNAFFNPSRVKIVRQEEEQQAETIPREELKRTFKYHLPGQTQKNAETVQYAEPATPIEVKRPHALTTTKVGGNISRTITKQSHDLLSEQENIASLKNPLINSVDIKRSGVFKKASSLQDTRLVHDFEGRSSHATGNEHAGSQHDVKRLDDLVIDILSHKVGESRLAQSCADLAMKMALEAKEIQKNANKDAVASTQVDYESTDRLEVPYLPQMSSDVVFAIQKAKKDWKSDDLEQMRTGSWAMDVAKKNLGAVTQESLKPDALKALGRLALQSLHRVADQKHDISLNEDDENDRTTFDYTLFKEKINQISNLKDLMKEESFRQDLQALQDGLLLEKSADEVMETFLETLRDEIVDEQTARSRTDILIGASSSASSDLKFTREIGENSKVSRIIMDDGRGEKIGKVHFKDDSETEISAKKTFDSAANELVHTVDRGIPPRRGFAIMETDAEEVEKKSYRSNY